MLSAAINGKGSNGEQARWNPATGRNLDGTEGKVSFFVKKRSFSDSQGLWTGSLGPFKTNNRIQVESRASGPDIEGVAWIRRTLVPLQKLQSCKWRYAPQCRFDLYFETTLGERMAL